MQIICNQAFLQVTDTRTPIQLPVFTTAMTAIGNAPDLLSASQLLTYIPLGWGWEVNLEFGINVYTLLYIKQIICQGLTPSSFFVPGAVPSVL